MGTGLTMQKTNKQYWNYVSNGLPTHPTNYHQISPTSQLGKTLKIIARSGHFAKFRYW